MNGERPVLTCCGQIILAHGTEDLDRVRIGARRGAVLNISGDAPAVPRPDGVRFAADREVSMRPETRYPVCSWG